MQRVVSFCFDDGFRRSADAICEVFSSRGLSACFAVLAAPSRALDPYLHGAELGDWAYWRKVRDSGHEVAAHGLIHENLEALSLSETVTSVRTALDIMEAQLPGFARARSLFHTPYMRAPEATVRWLGTQFLGVRLALDAAGRRGLNPWEQLRKGGPVDSLCLGPEGVAEAASARIQEFAHQQGWLVLVMHGVEGEGWGPIAQADLAGLLDQALALGMAVAPPDRVLNSWFSAGGRELPFSQPLHPKTAP